jgi:hypothetical protein
VCAATLFSPISAIAGRSTSSRAWGWGLPDSPGHYLDLVSAVFGLALLGAGLVVREISRTRRQSKPGSFTARRRARMSKRADRLPEQADRKSFYSWRPKPCSNCWRSIGHRFPFGASSLPPTLYYCCGNDRNPASAPTKRMQKGPEQCPGLIVCRAIDD